MRPQSHFGWYLLLGAFLFQAMLAYLKISPQLKHYIPKGLQYETQAIATNDATTPMTTPKNGDIFVPGTLDMTPLETLKRCYVDNRWYRPNNGALTIVTSEKYGIAYHLTAKSGSSTMRTVMKNSFNGTENKVYGSRGKGSLPIYDDPNIIHFSFFREPISRFLSGFGEVLWRQMRKPKEQLVPHFKNYDAFLKTFHYHLKNATLVQLKKKNGQPATLVERYQSLSETTEGAKAYAQGFERFVEAYDAAQLFDVHLASQVPGKQLWIDQSIPAHYAFHMEDGIFAQVQDVVYKRMAERPGNFSTRNLPNLTDFNARPKKHAANIIDFVSNATIQKICQLTAIDFCCLNYQLPPVCEGVVHCMWTNQTVPNSLPAKEESLSIEAVSPFPRPKG